MRGTCKKETGVNQLMSLSVRSFLAFDIENDEVKKKLAYTQKLLIQTGADLKLVETENIHVTIRFLGNITLTMVERIHQEMKTVQFIPFEIQIKGVGAFPNPNYPRVVWAGITAGSTELGSVFDQLEPRLQQLGFKPEEKGFNAHLTIARVRSGRNKIQLASFLKEYANRDFGMVRAECLRLKQSDLAPTGPVYSTLKEFCPQSGK
jgi:2'-5' RNA ligase